MRSKTGKCLNKKELWNFGHVVDFGHSLWIVTFAIWSTSKPAVRTTVWTEWCSWEIRSVCSPQEFLAGTRDRSLSGTRWDTMSIWAQAYNARVGGASVWLCVYFSACCPSLGGFVHANRGRGHWRSLRTVVSLLRCWHTHAVPGRKG